MNEIIVTILERLKLKLPFRNEKADYILMHDKVSGEVSAVPVDAVLAKVNDRVNALVYPDGFTKTTPVNRVGNTVAIAPFDFAWRIDLNPYSNASEFEKVLDPTTSPELKRIDTLAATKEGTIVYYPGVEDEFIIRAPDIRTDELRITDLTIFGDEVQEHTEPIITEVFTKEEKDKLALLDSTADIDKPVSIAQAAADDAILAAANFYTDANSFVPTDVNFGVFQSNLPTVNAIADTDKIPFLIGSLSRMMTWANFKNLFKTVNGNSLFGSGNITITSGVTTTIKTILSTALPTQNVAGFVTYLNALTPVLVVVANETVKYKTTDTGRVFELLLRGRSFGVGQAAITANDVLEVTEIFNKDITLSNYPSTRNDGQLPNNKVLGVNATGQVKLYSMAVSPAPWIRELIPDSYLPDTTGNIRILGDFFTPAMCDRVNNPNAIILGGVTTIHYANFVSSQEILINVTTGSVEGTFSCTLDNGLSTTKDNALLIVLGTVYKPLANEWNNLIGYTPVENSLALNVFNSESIATWNKEFDFTKNFQLRINLRNSPLGTVNYNDSNAQGNIFLLNASNDSQFLNIQFNHVLSGIIRDSIDTQLGAFVLWQGANASPNRHWENDYPFIFTFNKTNQTLKVNYRDQAPVVVSAFPLENVKIKFRFRGFDVIDCRYIELAT